MILPGTHFEECGPTFLALAANQILETADVPVLQHRLAPARSPRDEVVELASIHRLPAAGEFL
jgi:hypothetical protein